MCNFQETCCKYTQHNTERELKIVKWLPGGNQNSSDAISGGGVGVHVKCLWDHIS